MAFIISFLSCKSINRKTLAMALTFALFYIGWKHDHEHLTYGQLRHQEIFVKVVFPVSKQRTDILVFISRLERKWNLSRFAFIALLKNHTNMLNNTRPKPSSNAFLNFSSIIKRQCSVETSTYIHTYIDAYIHTYIHTYLPTYLPTDRPTNRPTDRPTDRPTNRLTDRPTDWPTNYSFRFVGS